MKPKKKSYDSGPMKTTIGDIVKSKEQNMKAKLPDCSDKKYKYLGHLQNPKYLKDGHNTWYAPWTWASGVKAASKKPNALTPDAKIARQKNGGLKLSNEVWGTPTPTPKKKKKKKK